MARGVSSAGKVLAAASVCLVVAGCANEKITKRGFQPSEYGVAASPRVFNGSGPIPADIKHRGRAVVGKPYTVAGKRYVPKDDPKYRSKGMASWYGDDFHGRLTANGEVYDMHDLSAAHPTLPLPSYARVTNVENGRSIVVRVNDRGPYHSGRVIDVSRRTAELLDLKRRGIGEVKVEYLGKASVRGADQEMLLATLRTDGSAAPRPGYPGGVMLAQAKPEPVPMPVMRAKFVPVGNLPPAVPDDDAPGYDPSLDLWTVPGADPMLPPTLAPERRAATDGGERLNVADIVGRPDKGQVMAFASLAPSRPALFVSAGVFADKTNAERLAALLSAGGDVAIEPLRRGEQTLWKVRAGPFATRADAMLARDLARQAGVTDAVVQQ